MGVVFINSDKTIIIKSKKIMSHLINTEIDTIYCPDQPIWRKIWHGLQTLVAGKIEHDGSNTPDTLCPIIELGVSPIALDGSNESIEITPEIAEQMSSWKLIAADCRNGKAKKIIPLHIPKKSYAIHQNKMIRDCTVKAATEVLGADGFEIVTEGTLDSYGQYMLSLAIKGSEKFGVGKLKNGLEDGWFKFLNFLSSHTGLIVSTYFLAFIRSVCWNTVSMGIEEALKSGEYARVKHTLNSLDSITPKILETNLRAWLESAENFQKLMIECKNQSMSLTGFQSFAAGIFTDISSDKISTTSFNRVVEMESLFLRGNGNSGESTYDGINAFTDYFSNGNGLGRNVTTAKRVASASFGRGNDWKKEAVRVASSEKEMSICCNRGEMLLHDRALMAKAN